jgi:tight adherence protein B
MLGYAILLFLIIVVGTLVVYLAMGKSAESDVQRVKDRLLGKTKAVKTGNKEGGGETPALIKSDEPQTSIAQKLLNNLQLAERVQALIEQAGLRWTSSKLMQFAMLGALGGFCFAWMMLPSPLDKFAWAFGIAGFCVPFVYVVRTGKARMKKFEEQFPDSLEFVARSMRAGHAFSVSLEMIHREFTEPLAGEFRRTFDEQNLGLPLENALQNLAKRVPLLEVHFFVSSVLLQKRTGGNLSELLDKLATLIRERFKLRGRIKAISAHGRITATTLSIIPMGVAFLMFYTNRDYIEFFVKDPSGNQMAGVAIFFQVVGYLIMKKIVTIEI